MDVGMLKSTATEDQMEMLMMMQTDKFPELCGLPYNNSSDILELEYSGTSTTSNGTTTTPIFHNNPHIQVAYPTLINSPASIPFMGITTTFQEAMASPLLPNLNVSEKIYPSPIFPEFVKQNGSMAAMREMMFRIAAMQPIQIDPESVKAPKRRNVKISKDPQSVAARPSHRFTQLSPSLFGNPNPSWWFRASIPSF